MTTHIQFLGAAETGSRYRRANKYGYTRHQPALVDGADELKIHGEYVTVRARVVQVQGLSAHADYAERIDWLRPSELAPKRVFVTHGEPAAADTFRRRLRDMFQWNVVVPDYGSTWALEGPT